MDTNGGDYLFHYTTRDATFEHILPSGRLRFSPYERMRDPLENKHWGFVGTSRGADDESQAQEMRAWSEFHHHANEIRSAAKLLSLTLDAPEDDDNDSRFLAGWARARMWEQYAECHKGVCLVFDRGRLIEAVSTSLKAQGLALPYNKPVSYSGADFAERLPLLDLRELSRDSSPTVVRRWVEDHHDDLFFRKTPDWLTEYEYRFVVTADSEFVYADYGSALETVIVGEMFPKWQLESAAASCAGNAEFWRVGWHNGFPSAWPVRSSSESTEAQ